MIFSNLTFLQINFNPNVPKQLLQVLFFFKIVRIVADLFVKYFQKILNGDTN